MKRSNIIPTLLDERFEQLKALQTAEDLQISLENSSIATDVKKEFVAERIRQLQAALEESKPAAEEIINSFSGDPQTWNFMRLRFIHGYSWVDIAFSLKLTEKMVKNRVYKAISKSITYAPSTENKAGQDD